MKVVVSVNDRYLWCLTPFSILFNKYWSSLQDVVVAGYSKPGFTLPSNFQYHSIASYNYPKEKWVDGMLEFMEVFRHGNPHFILLLEDYWLCRTVDVRGVGTLCDYSRWHPDILRVDLTADRLYAGGMMDVEYFGSYDIVAAPGSPYEMSLQAAIWNTDLFIEVLKKLEPDKHSAWSVELEGTTIVNASEGKYKVIGTRQYPVRYVNGYNSSTGFNHGLEGLNEEDKTIIKKVIPRWVTSQV